jgi:hypothetical protein
LSLGRNPLANLVKTAGEFARPSFVDVWFGNPQLEYRSDDGNLLRVENRQEVERNHLPRSLRRPGRPSASPHWAPCWAPSSPCRLPC